MAFLKESWVVDTGTKPMGKDPEWNNEEIQSFHYYLDQVGEGSGCVLDDR